MDFGASKSWWPGLSRPSTFKWPVALVERKRNPSRAFPRVAADDGFRCAQPILRVFAFLLATVPFATYAQSIEEKAQACAACHGEDGIPADKSWPVIWGQHQGYLYLQLRDFKNGVRKSDVMEPVAQAMQRDEMLAIALYFSKKAWPNLRQPRAEAAIAARAAQTNGSVGCTGCHQAGYQGEGTQPRLAGQSADYMLKTMLDFRSRARGNNPGMTDLMNATPEGDLKVMAAYLAGL